MTANPGSLPLAIVFVLAARSSHAQTGAWETFSGALAAQEAPRVLERDGSELVARGNRLTRLRDGRELELACTDVRGTGSIRDLALDPAGLVFVAAENGLFVVSPDVDALDRVWLWDGAPRGSPRSVFVDAQRRLWFATDQEIGAIDPTSGWGRTLTRAAGLPGGPPFRLAGEREGSLLVETASTTTRYRPDRAPEPAVTGLTVNGKPWRAGETIRETHGEPVHIVAEGRANGGATFRYRIDRHHVWNELGDEAIAGLYPGAHVIEVIAIDRDLRRSAPTRLAIDCALPPQYSKGFVARLALLVAALVTGFFVWRERRIGGGRIAWARAGISAAIAIVIGVQCLAGLVPHAKGWPFIGFSMYTNTYEEGSIIYEERVVGIDANGVRRSLSHYAVAPAIDSEWQVIWPLIDGGPTFSRGWIDRYNELNPGEPIVGLQTWALRHRLTREGAVRVAPLILSSYIPGARFYPDRDGESRDEPR